VRAGTAVIVPRIGRLAGNQGRWAMRDLVLSYQELCGLQKSRTVDDGWVMDGTEARNCTEAIRSHDVKQDMTDN
jgi:hypothetical protein